MINGQSRVFAGILSPVVDGGQYSIRRVVGQWVQVDAQVLCDGHDIIQAELQFKPASQKEWDAHRIWGHAEDRYSGRFQVTAQGLWQYRVAGWVDHGLTWREGLYKKVQDGQYVRTELHDGIELLESLIKSKKGDKASITLLKNALALIRDDDQYEAAVQAALSNELQHILYTAPEKKYISYSKVYEVYVDRKKALFSAWYEFFPRSASEISGQHGTFKDCVRLLPRVKEMGFDVLYFP
ncbi:MAG: DUF3416 domain-containing protein, partial [Saprospiraceae bacterium]|nr:DUF3416 domain-containing protein [Saprospiraceae bacterium]